MDEALGDNTQPVLINARFQHEKTGIFPAELVDAAANVEGWRIEPIGHPLARVIGGLPAEIVGEARVFRYFKMKLAPTARAVMNVAGDPLIAEKPLGRGKVVMFAAAPERLWTNMAVEPGFYPILLHEALNFVSRQAHEQSFVVSGPLVVPLPFKEEAGVKQATFLPPGAKPTTVAAVTREFQVFAELPMAEQPGFYEVRADQTMPRLFAAVNVDPRESRVQTLGVDALRELFGAVNVRVVPEGESVESSVRASRIGRELWRELLYVVLGLLVIEGLLARWFTRRKPLAA